MTYLRAFDVPVLALSGTASGAVTWTWLVSLNPILQAAGSIVAIVAGIAATWLTIEKIRVLRAQRVRKSASGRPD